MKAYIVEDEFNARNLLNHYLHKYTEVNVCGEAESHIKAISEIKSLKPDLVFMDISLPGKDGFEIMAEFPDRNFELIFVTAFEQHAIKALKMNALDYLLKPIDIGELIQAVEKAELKIKSLEKTFSSRKPKHVDERLLIPNGQELLYEPIANIIRLKASGRYTEIYLLDKKRYVVTRNLGEFEKTPALDSFIRTHNSHLINPFHIKAYNKTDGGSLIMSDGSSVEVSRRNRELLFKYLHTDQ